MTSSVPNDVAPAPKTVKESNSVRPQTFNAFVLNVVIVPFVAERFITDKLDILIFGVRLTTSFKILILLPAVKLLATVAEIVVPTILIFVPAIKVG